jgi:hypothetical protein
MPVEADSDWVSIDARPDVTIGAVDGVRPGHDLYYALSAVSLPDGTIVIANTGTNELRYFDRAGNLMATAGRSGGGPGEFITLTWPIGVIGDMVWAYDSRQLRLSLFNSRGEFIQQVATREMWAQVSDVLSDFSILIKKGGASPPGPPGIFRTPFRLLKITPYDSSTADLGTLAGDEGYRTLGLNGGCCTYTSAPFQRWTEIRSDGERIYIGEQDGYDIRVINADGTVLRIIRRAYEPRLVTKDMIAKRAERRLAELEKDSPWRVVEERILSETEYPETLPAHGRLLTDPHGRLWVQNYRNPWENPPRWSIFDTTGQWLGNVTLPDDLALLWVGHDHVIGRMVDELDVERIQVHAITADRGMTP